MSHFNIPIQSEVIEAAMKGDIAAYKEIYETFSTPVYNLSYRILNNKEDALDMLQNVMEVLFNKIKHFSGEGQFSFWVRKITFNQCLNVIRSQKMKLQPLTDEAVSETVSPHDHQYDVLYYLKQLPVLSRAVLWLHTVEGFTHAEIAEQFNMSESFSKSQLSRTKKMLTQLTQLQENTNEQKNF